MTKGLFNCRWEAAEGGRGNLDVDQHSLAVLRTSQQVGSKPESGNLSVIPAKAGIRMFLLKSFSVCYRLLENYTMLICFTWPILITQRNYDNARNKNHSQ